MQARHQVDGNSITPCDAHSTASTRRHRPKERRANACFTLCILACNTTSPKTAKGQRRPFVGFYSRMIDDWNTFCLRWSDRLCLSCGIVTAIAAIVGITNAVWLGDGFVPCAFINTRLLDWEVRNCSLVKAIDISASRLRWPTWNDSIDLFEVDCSDVDKVLAARWSQLIAAVAENYNIRETGCNTSISPVPGSAVIVHIDPSIVLEHGICRTEETACSISKMFDENARKSGLRKVVAVIDPSPCTSFDCEGFAAARVALNIIAQVFGAASCLLTVSIAGLCLLNHIHDRRAQAQLEPARSGVVAMERMDARINGEPRGERRREQQHDVSNASPRCVRCNAADTRTLACEQCGAVQLLALHAQSFSFVPANAGDDDDDDDDADVHAEDDATGMCVVCLERFTGGDQCVNLPCLHRYHSDCIAAWLSQVDSCPICKRTILESLREAELLASAPVPAPKSKRKRRARRNRHRLHVSQAVH
jgi:hypothetical protein